MSYIETKTLDPFILKLFYQLNTLQRILRNTHAAQLWEQLQQGNILTTHGPYTTLIKRLQTINVTLKPTELLTLCFAHADINVMQQDRHTTKKQLLPLVLQVLWDQQKTTRQDLQYDQPINYDINLQVLRPKSQQVAKAKTKYHLPDANYIKGTITTTMIRIVLTQTRLLKDGLATTDTYPHCNLHKETLQHIITQCPRWKHFRQRPGNHLISPIPPTHQSAPNTNTTTSPHPQTTRHKTNTAGPPKTHK